jgi:DNA-binding transcriptional ArsR family regulator
MHLGIFCWLSKIMAEKKQNEEMSFKIANLLKVIANPIRLQVLCCLLSGEKSVSHMLDLIDISQSALSQHLSILREKNVLKDNKVGKFIYYSIINQETVEILGFLKNICEKNHTKCKS